MCPWWKGKTMEWIQRPRLWSRQWSTHRRKWQPTRISLPTTKRLTSCTILICASISKNTQRNSILRPTFNFSTEYVTLDHFSRHNKLLWTKILDIFVYNVDSVRTPGEEEKDDNQTFKLIETLVNMSCFRCWMCNGTTTTSRRDDGWLRFKTWSEWRLKRVSFWDHYHAGAVVSISTLFEKFCCSMLICETCSDLPRCSASQVFSRKWSVRVLSGRNTERNLQILLIWDAH